MLIVEFNFVFMKKYRGYLLFINGRNERDFMFIFLFIFKGILYVENKNNFEFVFILIKC